MRSVRYLIVAWSQTFLMVSASAQVASLAATSTVISAFPSSEVPAREAFVLYPDGRITRAVRPPLLRLQSEVLANPEALDDLLQRHNLAADAKNREMFVYLNPWAKLNQGVIGAGTKVDIFSVYYQGPARRNNLRYSFDTTNLTKYPFYSHAEKARELTNSAKNLPAKGFDDPSLAEVHLRATDNLRFAAESLEARSDKLTRLEFAVAQFQIEDASKQLADINTVALGGVASREQVISASASALAAKSTADRIQTGARILDMMEVEVNVFSGDSDAHVTPLQVYVIPSGPLNEPSNWTSEQLEGFFSDFSFANDASPVSQAIPRNFDPRVCIGPKNSIKGMAKLVSEGKLSVCRKPAPAIGGTKTVLTFRAPQDIAKP